MRLGFTIYYDGERVPILNGYNANIKNLTRILQIEEELLIQILRKYGAIFGHKHLDYYFINNSNCEDFINSPELEPYVIMLELCEEN